MKYLLFILLLTGCIDDDILIPPGQKYFAGDQIIIRNGFYKDCKATITKTEAYWAFKGWCETKRLPCTPKYNTKNVICKGILITDDLDVYEDSTIDLGITNRKSL